MKRWMATAAVVLATATGAAGQECEAGERDCFRFWTGCNEIGLMGLNATLGEVVPLVRVGDNIIGVREADVVNAGEFRLRAAGLYTEARSATGELVLHVRFLGTRTFDVGLSFLKRTLRDEYGFTGRAVTWTNSTLGTHGGSAAFVMEEVRRLLDEFMNAYLRVNAPACAARRQDGQR